MPGHKFRLFWIENCIPISSRSQRIIDSLRASGNFEVRICAWSRSADKQNANPGPDYLVHTTPIGYKKLLAKALALPSFARFVRRALHEESPDLLACNNWDMAFVATTVGKKGLPIVYDVGDMPDGNGIYLQLGRLAEFLSLRAVSGVILASRFFDTYYKNKVHRRLIFENYPALPPAILENNIPTAPPRIAYIGNVRFSETLVPLLEEAAARNIGVDIFGGGPDLEKLQLEFSDRATIKFHGKYRYADLPAIYSKVDIVWAAYPATDENVRYAISNKFFESIHFCKPGVFSAQTKLGELVEKEQIGFVVDASNNRSVAEWLDNLNSLDLVSRMHAALFAYREKLGDRIAWDSNAANLVEFFMRAVRKSTK